MSGSDESARLERVYDLSATAAWIRAGGFRRVALQIPDDLLHDAVNLAAALERRCVASGDAATASGGDAVPPTRVFVLADTTFGRAASTRSPPRTTPRTPSSTSGARA